MLLIVFPTEDLWDDDDQAGYTDNDFRTEQSRIVDIANVSW